MPEATSFILQIGIVLMSVVIHEVSHGIAAYLQGDKTAQYAGRLTLNPIPHLDPIGSVLIPLILVIAQSPVLIGWAKPVPYNPYNLRDQKWGPAKVGAAGPGSNIFIAGIFGAFSSLLPLTASEKMTLFSGFLTSGFSGLGIATTIFESLFLIFLYIVLVNLFLAFFNLVPLPPLDGSKVLFSILPYRWYKVQAFLETYGFYILIALVFIFRGFFFTIIMVPVSFLFQLFTGLGL